MYNKFQQKMDQIIQKYNTKTAITYLKTNGEEEKRSFSEVGVFIHGAAGDFQEMGLVRGDRVAIVSPHSPYAVFMGLALAYSGMTIVLIDAALPSEEIEQLIEFSDVRAVFTTEKIYTEIIGKYMYPCFSLEQGLKVVPFDAEKRTCSGIAPTVDPEEDVIAILFSSGTTDQMKGIKVTYKSVLKAQEVIVRLAGLEDYMSYLLVLPFNHIGGFAGATSYFMTGCELGFIEDVNPSKLADGLLRYQPHYFVMVPKVFEVMEERIREKLHEKGKLVERTINFLLNLSGFLRKHFGIKIGKKIFKGITSQVFGKNIYGLGTGASPCKESTAEFFLNLGLEWANMYATTEGNVPIASTGVHDRYPADSIGNVNANPEIQIKINNPDEDGVGEILVKSELIMKGYFRQPDLTKKAFEDGYFKTGDYGFVDKKGYLHLTGRIKESIVLRTGKKVSPVDVDDYYTRRLPDVELASRGIANAEGYDEIFLFAEDKSYSSSEKEIIAEKLRNLSIQAPSMYKIKNVYFIEEIPKTIVGKVKRFSMEIPAEGQPLKEEEKKKDVTGKIVQSKSDKEILFEVINRIAENDNNREYNGEEKLESDIGMDSLSLFEMCVALQEQTGTSIEGYLYEDITVGEVLDLLKSGTDGMRQGEDITQYPYEKTKRIQRNFRRFRKLSKHFWDIEALGVEKLDFSKQYIFCPNHESHFDGMWIMTCLPEQIQEKMCSMAADYLFEKRIYRFGVEIMGGIPVHRGGNTTIAMNRIYDCLVKEGYSVLIHPEGTRTRNGKLGEFKLGAAELSKKSSVEIVPVHISGARQIYPPDKKYPRFSKENGKKRKLVIRFGNPIATANKSEQEITNEIRKHMREKM